MEVSNRKTSFSICYSTRLSLSLQKKFLMDVALQIIGYLAGICLAIAQFPQAIKVYRTKDTHSISLLMFSILTTGVFFWFLYGALAGIPEMWITNGICLLPSFYILYMSIKNLRNEKKE